MAKKKRQKAGKGGSTQHPPGKLPQEVNVRQDERPNPDYGGIPDIDFRKNLGCG